MAPNVSLKKPCFFAIGGGSLTPPPMALITMISAMGGGPGGGCPAHGAQWSQTRPSTALFCSLQIVLLFRRRRGLPSSPMISAMGGAVAHPHLAVSHVFQCQGGAQGQPGGPRGKPGEGNQGSLGTPWLSPGFSCTLWVPPP